MKHAIELLKEEIEVANRHLNKFIERELNLLIEDQKVYISQLESELQQLEGMGWRDVKERKPDIPPLTSTQVLATDGVRVIVVMWRYNEFSTGQVNLGRPITHWMPLPTPPWKTNV